MEFFEKGKEYCCFKCGQKYGKPMYNKEKDCLEFLCGCGYMIELKPLQETAITEVVESDKPILLG
jgi:hypothetical protein